MPTLVLEHGQLPGGTGILGETLRTYGHRRAAMMVARGDPLPVEIDDIDAILLSDGPATIASGPGWLDGECALLRAAHTRGIPIVGLGLGARILAHALGGQVAASPAVPAIAEVTLSAVGREDPLYKGCPWGMAQPILEPEMIATLPNGAAALASSVGVDGTPCVRAFSAGIFAFGFTHSWWFDEALLTRTLAEQPARDASASSGFLSAWKRDADRMLRMGARIAESIALYLMPVDRLHAGRVKDLHY